MIFVVPTTANWCLRNVAQEPEFTDKAVTANKEYQYRVTAENEGGESKPSEPSELIKAKALKGWLIIPLYFSLMSVGCLNFTEC